MEQYSKQIVFRPVTKVCIKKALTFLLFSIVLAPIPKALIHTWIFSFAGIALVLTGIIFDILLPLLKNRILMDETGFVAFIDGKKHQLSWNSIDAIKIGKNQYNTPWTMFFVNNGQITTIPIKWMDEKAIHNQILTYVDPIILKTDTWDGLLDMLLSERLKEFFKLDRSFRFECYSYYQLVGIACFVFFSFISILSVNSKTPGSLFVLILFALLGLFIFIQYRQKMQIDQTGVTKLTIFGTDFIGWDEITTLRFSPGESRIILQGDDKRLVIAAIEYWNGKEGSKAIEVFRALLDKYKIEIQEDRLMAYKVILSKNTKKTNFF